MPQIICIHLFSQITPEKYNTNTPTSKSARIKHHNGNYNGKMSSIKMEKQKLFQPYKSED